MSYPHSRWYLALPVALGVVVAGLWPGMAQGGVKVALTPAIQNVALGADFDVFVDVTEAGSPFNGFDFVVDFDPAALTFVPLVPSSNQQGCLMTGACSSACGNTFHVFSAQADSINVSDVLLCNQTTLTGPGRIYVLRFHASNTPQATQLVIRRTNFYNAGLYVTPVQKSGCMIGIGVTLDVDGPAPRTFGGVRVEPNPSRGGVSFVLDDLVTDVTGIEVLDVHGRVVRRLHPPMSAAGTPPTWDGFDTRGRRVPPGIYLARISRGPRVQSARIVLLP